MIITLNQKLKIVKFSSLLQHYNTTTLQQHKMLKHAQSYALEQFAC
jgi:hypothetical protein